MNPDMRAAVPLQLGALIVYSGALVLFGLWVSKRVEGTGSFFVADRKLGAGLVFSTFLAAAEKTKVKKKLVSKAKKKKTRRKVKKKRVVRKKPTPSQRVRPKNLPKAPKKVTSFRQGGSKRLGKKPGASAATKKKDLSKVGILGILGSGGYRPNTDKASTGVGILQGISTEMTGGVGESEDLLGKNLGVKLKDDGAGSTGFATTGIDDVGTKGLGGGVPALETVGIGKRVRPEIEFGGDEEEFIGKIDPEAIRRVIRSNKNQLENCYERQLNKNRELASGKVIIGWKLAVGGRVLDPQMKSVSPGFSEVGDCVIRRLQTWRFPEPPAGQEVEISAYPFLFEKR